MHGEYIPYILIFLASFAAGMVNSVAGGGTLITFPTLVWLGRDPILANATNAVALWPGSLAGMLGYRREMAGSRHWMALLVLPSMLGGVLGALLLLRTPSKTFSFLVPYLILFATVLLALQEPISRGLRAIQARMGMGGNPGSSRWGWAAAAGFQFLVAVYGGYFGAGMGILMLAAMGLLGLKDIHQMNGLKNLLGFLINAMAAVYFAFMGAVIWQDALIMAAGATAGGYGGANLALRLGRTFIRRLVIFIGAAMTLALFLRN
jgi:uncharacterized membrane protein YfcA